MGKVRRAMDIQTLKQTEDSLYAASKGGKLLKIPTLSENILFNNTNRFLVHTHVVLKLKI